MKKLEIKQNTPEWLAFRKTKLGASDCAKIMGLSPWDTPYSLWLEKIGEAPEKQENRAIKRGVALEPIARATFSFEMEMAFEPVTILHDSIDYMMASLDGMSKDEKNIVEIKCPGVEDHRLAISGKIPQKYFPQLQHQIEVCQVDKAYYYSFDGENGVVIEVFRDEEYIKKIIQAEQEFWECIQNLTPPSLMEKDFEIMDSVEWKLAASEWSSTKRMLSDIEKKEKELKEKLILMSENRNAKGHGIQLKKVIRKGAVDYSSITELQGIDLDKYRKKPSEYFLISEVS